MLVLGPNDNQLQTNKSDMTDSRFNGKRQIKDPNSVPVSNDYTLNTPADASLFKPSLEEIKMDIDALNDSFSLKNFTKRNEDLLNRGGASDASFIFMLDITELLLEELSSVWQRGLNTVSNTQPSSVSYWNTPMTNLWNIPMYDSWDIPMEE